MQQAQASGNIMLDSFPIEPNILDQFQQNLPDQTATEATRLSTRTDCYATAPSLYRTVCRTFAQGLAVLSYNEIPENRQINVVGNLG